MTTDLPERLYDAVTRRLPPASAARLDLLRPSFRTPWGGPLNGQTGRQAIVHELFRSLRISHVIETGTFRGTTTEFLAVLGGVRVDTVEAVPRNYEYARRRLADLPLAHVHLGDSRALLQALSAKPLPGTTFVYLDAHWEEDLPLAEELSIVASAWADAVVMIDDFEVPDDPGYKFDDYGPGRRLDDSLLDASDARGWSRFRPVLRGHDEDGARSGCVVLASPSQTRLVERVSLLRAA